MKKLKALMFGLLSVLTLGLFVVTGTTVNAKTLSSNNKIATWYRSSAADISEILMSQKDSKVTYATATFSAGTTFDISNRYVLIPVPQNATGKVKVLSTQTNSSKKITLLNSTGSNTTTQIEMNKDTAQDASFSSDNVINYDNNYYVGFSSVGNDCKISYFSIDLSEGTGEYASQVTVSYYLQGQNTAFATETVNSGATASGNAKCWGKNIIDYFTDSACSASWTNKVVSSDTSIYCTYTDWDSSVYGVNGYVLSNNLIELASESFSLNDSSTEIPNTIFTILGKCKFDKYTVNSVEYDVINTNGNLSTSGPTRGLQFTVTAPGVIRAYVNGIGSTGRTVKLTDSTAENTIATSQEITATGMDLVEFNVLAAGTYIIGGSNKINIFSASFTENTVKTPVLEQQENGTGTAIRFIATVEGITSETQVASWKVIISTAGKTDYVSSSFTDLYTAVTANNAAKDNGKDAADDTLYLVATLKNIPASYNDVTISTKVVVTLNDDNHTILTSNVVTHKIKVTTTTE